MTAVVFPKFSNLPPELRDKIFHCALPGLRLFTTKCHPFYRTEGHGVALGQDRYSPIPTPLLHTSKEARKAVQRRYTIENIFYYPDKWLPAYIDWEVDTISLGVMEFFRILEGIEANPTTFMYDNSSVNNWRKSTRNLVVTILAIEYAFEKNSHWIADFLKYFPRLDTLVCCFPNNGTRVADIAR